jgi:predicted MFS family arabinose efflux permease
MLALGAALGGVVAGQWGLKPAFVIDSLTFFISAAFIAQVRYRKPLAMETSGRGVLNVFFQYAEGLRYINQNRDILVIALQKATMALGVTSAFQVIQVSLAREVFVIGEGGSTSLGIFYAVVGAGTGLGPILARRFTGDDEPLLRRAIALGYPIAGIGLLIVSSLVNFPTVLFGTLLRGFGASVTWVFSTQLLLQLVPNQVRGRVFSTEYALVTLSNAIGAGLGGWALDNLPINLPQMLWGMTAITLLTGGLWTLAGLLRTSQGAEPVPAHQRS